eukprot:TRINITY_DN70_c0_g2_i3.p1 TRINITY_DN70_c0_g2~~TRINITY_DN70_c0_g2_i3.p1  ORF type:complete len:398 (+),score=103.71 TRINITY_DN70_c0_g2_i3:74-1267(+)
MKSAFFCLFSMMGLTNAAYLAGATGKVIEGEYIIMMNKNATSAHHDQVFTATNGIKKFSIGDSYKAIHAKLNTNQIDWLKKHGAVELIEHNQVVTTADNDQMVQKLSCPNSQGEPLSWGQKRTTTSSPEDVVASFAHDRSWGTNVDAYVVDTGVRCTHNEFTNRCIWGTNTAGGSNTDVNGHGTHCAGTIAGSTYGIAKSATVIAVKVLGDNGSGTTAGVIAGVEWVATNAKSRGRRSVANMSLGGGYSAASNNAVDAAVKEGTSFAVAAGNDNRDACNYSPASASDCVTVGSTALESRGNTPIDGRSTFSNYGTCVDIFAPGSSIIAAYASSDSAYATLSGTSMASPHVAGAMAVLLTSGSQTPSQIKSALDAMAGKDLVNNAGSGSPNKFLHVQC